MAKLEGHGFILVPLGDPRAEHSLMFEFHERQFRKFFASQPTCNRSLVIFEPRSVNPSNYSVKTRSNFSTIWVPSCLMATDANDISYQGGGYYLPMKELQLSRNEVREVDAFDFTFVNENKFSLIKGSLYSFRARSIRMLVDSGYKVAIAGKNWDKSTIWQALQQAWHGIQALANGQRVDLRLLRLPLPPKYLANYYGRVDSPVEFYSRGRFALVIENEAVYVTEKLFNALAAGVVPIYCGPALSSFNIPPDIAIEVGPDPRLIIQAVREVSEDTLQSTRQAGRTFLSEPSTDFEWLQEAVFERLASSIRRKLKNDESS